MQNLHSLPLRQQVCQVGPAACLLMHNSVGWKYVEAVAAFRSRLSPQ